ncbi:hypothetical protein AM587_10001447 [Phytophthora nicotianae]|uniref:Uncharacterized protein n=1 Tax=Phytophthora nicotianae TaxID=4792 RepID=A0A0W8CJR3_PHYNI|nr:hypothetical protein AM587_10001447 [Phytophthora nicotianae]
MHEPPKGLETECRFFTPEGWKKRGQGQHLVDYFDGPDEIWQHLPGKAPARVPAKSPAKSSAKTPSEAVDISTGNDLLSSGDESEFFVDDDEDIDIEANSDVSEDDEESDATSDEEDPTDLSVGTPFDSMSKEELSSHANTGWTTYLEMESTY